MNKSKSKPNKVPKTKKRASTVNFEPNKPHTEPTEETFDQEDYFAKM